MLCVPLYIRILSSSLLRLRALVGPASIMIRQLCDAHLFLVGTMRIPSTQHDGFFAPQNESAESREHLFFLCLSVPIFLHCEERTLLLCRDSIYDGKDNIQRDRRSRQLSFACVKRCSGHCVEGKVKHTRFVPEDIGQLRL